MEHQTKLKGSINPIFIIAALFFIFGFVTWLNSVLIPYLKIACELNDFESYLVAFAFYISYLVMAIPSGIVLRKTGFKNGMALGLLIMAVCLGGHWLISRISHSNTRTIWITESILVVLIVYGFYKS